MKLTAGVARHEIVEPAEGLLDSVVGAAEGRPAEVKDVAAQHHRVACIGALMHRQLEAGGLRPTRVEMQIGNKNGIAHRALRDRDRSSADHGHFHCKPPCGNPGSEKMARSRFGSRCPPQHLACNRYTGRRRFSAKVSEKWGYPLLTSAFTSRERFPI